MFQVIKISFMTSVTSKTVKPLCADDFYRIIDSDAVLKVMRAIERTSDAETKREMKKQLPVALYACKYQENGIRPTLQTAEPSGLCVHDWDKMDCDVKEFYLENIKGHEQELGIVLVHKTPSGNGLRIVSELMVGEDTARCQRRLAEMFGMQKYADCSVKDITRLSFIPSREYFYYIDEVMLFGRTEEVEEKVEEEVDTQCTAVAPAVVQASMAEACAKQIPQPQQTFADDFKYDNVIPFSRIIKELLSRIATNARPVVGERNSDLYTLVRELRHVTQYNFEMTRMLVAPYFSDLQDREIRMTVNSALNSNGRTMTPTMQAIIQQLRTEIAGESYDNDPSTGMPRMPKLPPFMETVCSLFPKEIKQQVVLAMLPILGAYGTHIRFRYLDNRVNSLSFMTAIVGKSGGGKAFAQHLFSLLTPMMEAWDKGEREKAQHYQDAMRKCKDSDEKPDDPRPKVRLFSDEITTSMMLEYLDNLNGEHGLQFTEEINRLVKSKKSHYGDNDDIYCKAFDNGYGGKESKSALTRNLRIKIYLNTLFCGTYNAMHKFYDDPEGGLNNRVIFAAIPNDKGHRIPFYKEFTREQATERDTTLTMLYHTGTAPGEEEFRLPFLEKAIEGWIKKCNKEDDDNPDTVWRNLANRSAVMGFRAGMLAYFLWGRPEDKKTQRHVGAFAKWVAETARICIYNFCGEEYEIINQQNMKHIAKTRMSKNKKLLSELGNNFTLQDVINLRVKNGDSEDVTMVICRWNKDGSIIKNADGTFTKVKQVKLDNDNR